MLFTIKEALDSLATPLFNIRGKRPWGLGYYTAKKNAITAAIDSGVLARNSKLPKEHGIQIDERVVEYPWVFSHLPKDPGKVLDAGSALNHKFLLDRAPLSKAQLTIMTLAPEKRCFWDRSISYVFGDLRDQDFSNNIFDTVVSVSTIEHIGLDNTMLYTADEAKSESDEHGFEPAVKEYKRVIKLGGMCLITVPFGRRGVHGWYQVFDEDLIVKVVEAFNPSSYMIDYFGYKNSGWHEANPDELKNAEFYDFHADKQLPSDLAAGARGVACIKMIS